MESKQLVDPELLPALDIFPALGLTADILPMVRSTMAAQLSATIPPAPASLVIEQRLVPGAAGDPPVKVVNYRPAGRSDRLPALIHMHGGGYVMGTPDLMDQANRALALDLGCAIFSVDYRLSPENKYPAALYDCYAVLKWLNQEADEIGIDSNRIGLKGESAGGGLAAALALLARDRAEFSVACQHLIYPMIDDRTALMGDEYPLAGQFVWTREDNRFGWDALLDGAPGSPQLSPYAAAARSDNLSGLPPTYIAVGALDLFLNENLAYAARLIAAGVPVELHVYPGAFHGFEIMPQAHVSVSAARNSLEALHKAFCG